MVVEMSYKTRIEKVFDIIDILEVTGATPSFIKGYLSSMIASKSDVDYHHESLRLDECKHFKCMELLD